MTDLDGLPYRYHLHPLDALMSDVMPRGVPAPPNPSGVPFTEYQTTGAEANYHFIKARGRGATSKVLTNFTGAVLNTDPGLPVMPKGNLVYGPYMPEHNYPAKLAWEWDFKEPTPIYNVPTKNMDLIQNPTNGKSVSGWKASMGKKGKPPKIAYIMLGLTAAVAIISVVYFQKSQ